eukprot:TRINITY_DN13054_c0_g1::TRINITY_DN13054_c0_g1_i1::g.10663::m.10663 TRINITY_DN13054_c0_g1::TRINITY_DN13054_c0_g1_i1::g.10663  ORF type:complete len:355 (-),score=83.54,sp/O15160/RPAC1_HUMAN/53.51/3e-100,RNA_pol_A_bac/PF01000.21/3e-29,RNA_pol_L/PF01193.19/7.9e-18,Fer4_7/PF12838.2/0.051 TRINITY_DN13054_c0_g1_i1:561-1577(-)
MVSKKKEDNSRLRDLYEYVDCKTDAPSSFGSGGVEGSRGWIDKFDDKLDIEIVSMDENDLIFDMSGVDAPIANALRRIMLSEVPTMAIEKVFIADNTSIIQDEILAHRFGLIPLRVDPREFDFPRADGEETDRDTLTFTLDVTCKHRPNVPENAPDEEKYENCKVYSRDIKWVPQGDQETKFPMGVSPVHEDILIAKLRPGQRIKVELHAHKGIGKQHAKWSPVCTASYRLLPEIRLTRPFLGEEAENLVKKCPLGVFEIEEASGESRAVVANPRSCTMCRECIRDVDWDRDLKLLRKRTHFIFSVESTGALAPDVLVLEAIRILKDKASCVLQALDD